MMFDKAYCIVLNENWNEKQKEFKKINIDVEKFDAITPDNLQNNQYKNTYTYKHNKLTLNNYASFETHLAIIKKAKKEKLKNVLIFEEDVYFTKNASLILNNALKELPEDWDMISLGAWLRGNVKRHSDHIYRYYSGWLLHAYVINHTLFNVIIEKATPSTDNFFRQQILPYYNCYIVIPMIAFQHNNVSSINPNRDITPHEGMLKYNPEIWNKVRSIYMKRNITLPVNVFDDGYNINDDY